MGNTKPQEIKEGNLISQKDSKVLEVIVKASSEANDILSIENPYPSHKGYLALYEQYGKDEKYKDFFSKLKIERNDIILDNKKYGLLRMQKDEAESLWLTVWEMEIWKGVRWMSWVVYLDVWDAVFVMQKLHKKMFARSRMWIGDKDLEFKEFINKFPWELFEDKLQAFTSLMNFENYGYLYDKRVGFLNVWELSHIGLTTVWGASASGTSLRASNFNWGDDKKYEIVRNSTISWKIPFLFYEDIR